MDYFGRACEQGWTSVERFYARIDICASREVKGFKANELADSPKVNRRCVRRVVQSVVGRSRRSASVGKSSSQLESGRQRGIVDFMRVEEIKKSIESLSEVEFGEVAAFLSVLRPEVAETMAPEKIGMLAHRLAGNKSPSETSRLSAQIIDGFYAGS